MRKLSLFIIGIITLLVVPNFNTSFAQTDRYSLDIPRDKFGNPVSVLYGYDQNSNTFKSLSFSGAIFDSMWVDTLVGVGVSWIVSVIPTTATTAAGLVLSNYSTSAIICSTNTWTSGGTNIYVNANTSKFIPLKIDTLWVKTTTSLPNIEIQVGTFK